MEPPSQQDENRAGSGKRILPILLQSLLILLGIALVAALVVITGKNIRSKAQLPTRQTAVITPSPLPEDITLPAIDLKSGQKVRGLFRWAQLDTLEPLHSRFDVSQYEVVSGDSVFAIAEKFGLSPETIMWSNYETLYDNPTLQPGMVLNILPVDGLYYRWNNGDSLEKVAAYYSVTSQDILDFPGNHLDINTLGDPVFPSIPEGTMLIVPGGKRTYISWITPGITREDPGLARILGPGACGPVSGGPVAGSPPYAWPAPWHFLSGYDYSPSTNHFGIDIAGRLGHTITSVADGVVVYAGWNYGGYGNVVVVDHGNGYQTIYAHLDSLTVQCGSWVYTGSLVGYMGSTGRSTGPHLHFEIQGADIGRANPWLYLVR